MPAPTLALAHLLRQARQTQHLSLQALAQRCTRLGGRRVTSQYLSNLEHGHRLPSLPVLQVLATVLALDPAALGAAILRLRPPVASSRLPGDSTVRAVEDLLAHVQHATQHVTQAQQAYHAALVAARQAGASWRQLAIAAGRSQSRIRQQLGRTPGTAEPMSPMLRHP